MFVFASVDKCMAPVAVLALMAFSSLVDFAIAAPTAAGTDASVGDSKPASVLLQAGISHSAFLPPLKLNEIDQQINAKSQPAKSPVVVPKPQAAPAVQAVTPLQSVQPPQPVVKDPAQSLRKELGNMGQVDRATAYQKLLNLSAQKSGKKAPPPLKASATLHNESKTTIRKAKVEATPKNDLQKFEVPDWLAGVWQRTQMTETKRTSLPGNRSEKTSGTSTAVVTDAFGTYRDKNGRIYQVFDSHAPAGQVDRGATIDIEHIFDYQLKVLDSKRALVQAKAWHVQVGKFDKRLIMAYQDEEFNVYTSLGPGKLRTDSSVKVFDKAGKPTMITQSYSSETRIRKP